MAKVFIEETTLTAIGNAIRDKEGSTALIPVPDMATRISAIETGGGGGGNEPTTGDLTFTGNRGHLFRNGNWDWLIDKYADKIKFQDVTSLDYAFSGTNKTDLSVLELHTKNASFNGTFSNNSNLKKLPKVAEGSTVLRYITTMFSNCYNLTSDEINAFLTSFLPPTAADTNTAYNAMFVACASVRDLTPAFDWLDGVINSYTGTSTSYTNYNQALYGLSNLDKVTNMYVVTAGGARTSNAFSSAFYNCYRLSEIMFKTNNGTPYNVNWKAQTIDLATGIGHNNGSNWGFYNSGITADKEVKDDATYQALKNDSDWWTKNIKYSRYNHDSAVNTINSLPDTSAYLASAGGTNTIKFKGQAGELTDGGAINTLTAEEIAVATAKGWTVTMV